MRLLIAFWGVGGVVLLLTQAVVRLTPLALEPIYDGTLLSWQVALYVVSVIVMGFSEGYRGFQRAFSPRVVARSFYLSKNYTALSATLAPLYAMGLCYATKKRLIVSWGLLVTMICLIFFVRRIDQPYRGIIDAGVVVGLGWGMVAMAVFFVQTLRGRQRPFPLDVPGQMQPTAAAASAGPPRSLPAPSASRPPRRRDSGPAAG